MLEGIGRWIKGIGRDLWITIALAIVIFLSLQFTIQVSIVEGPSMKPNLYQDWRLIVNKVAYHFGEPEAGDVIVFINPYNPDDDPFIKRIIGLPGDTVELKSTTVYVNGTPIDEPYISEPRKYNNLETTVPEDNYFVLGDNRTNSSDSRSGWTVPRDDIIGKAWILIWPVWECGVNPNYSFDEPTAESTS